MKTDSLSTKVTTGFEPRRWFQPTSDWPYLVVVAAPLILFAPFLLGQQVLYFGTPLLQFYPWRLAALAAVRGGEWPLWNPWVGNGAPLLANYQSALLYPVNWLSLLLPLDISLGWLAALHLALAGAGMVTLARQLGLRPLGQVIAGLAFGLSQYLVARAGFLSINATVAWLPWVVWAVDWQTSRAGASWRQRLRPAVALSAAVGLMLLAGHAQTAWYTLLIASAWGLWRLMAGRAPWPERARAAVWLAFSVLVGVGLAAAQWLPTAELMRESPRAERADYNFVMAYSYSPFRLLTLLAPDLLGNPARGRYYGYGNYWEDAGYAGVVPLILALGVLAGGLGAFLRARPWAEGPTAGLPLFLGSLLLLSVMLALGQNTGLFPLFYNHVPTFNLFQAPARLMIGLVFALALLAGLGADRWQPPRGRALYWARLGTAGAVALALMGFATLLGLPFEPRLVGQLRVLGSALGLAGVSLVVAGVLTLLQAKLPARVWTAAVVLFVMVDLLYANFGLNPGAPRGLYSDRTASGVALASATDGHRLLIYPAEEQVAKFERLLSFETFGPPGLAQTTREAQLPNVAVLDGLASANNYEPLVSARYAGLLAAAEATQSMALLRMMNVSVLASGVPRSLLVVSQVPAIGLRFYRVPGEPRRAWVVHQARWADGPEAALAMLADPAFDPATTVILEAGDGTAGGGGRPDVSPAPLAVTSTFNTVTISGVLAEPGWVVLADTHYPGWVARVDGRLAPILHANYALRAVAVEAGTHTIEFSYRPRSFYLGLAISLASLLVGISAGYLSRRRKLGEQVDAAAS